MNNLEFINKAIDIAQNYKTAYVWGTFGMVASASNMKTMINQYSKNSKYEAKAKQIYGNGYFFDCVGLIKGILWGWHGDKSLKFGGAKYGSNNVSDRSADQMISICSNVSSNFRKIEAGEVVWMSGHIGIYVGNGVVVESTPAWKGGVQKSALANIGTIEGLNSRKWTKHGKLPYIEYNNTKPLIKFNDIDGHYAYNHITKLAELGTISGYSDGTFKPDKYITRAEFSAITVNILEKVFKQDLKSKNYFADTHNHWAESYINKLAACGIVLGVDGDNFEPDAYITRGQAAIIGSLMLRYMGIKERTCDTYPDVIGHYAERHITNLKAYGVVNGCDDSKFYPDAYMTRGQAAIILGNCITVVNG